MQQTRETVTEPKQLQMEERECRGCPKTFRVLIKSPQAFCSAICQQDSGLSNPKPTKAKPWASLERDKLLYGEGQKIKPTLPRVRQEDVPKNSPHHVEVTLKEKATIVVQRPVIEPKQDTIVVQTVQIIEPDPEPEPTIIPPIVPSPVPPNLEDQWDGYVKEAKTHVKVMNNNRMEVAELAMKACDIKLGGGNHWKKFEGVYTLKKFAEEINVHYKTLSQWCAVKRLVKDKLPEGVWDESDYTAALRTQNKIDKNTDPKSLTDVYQDELNRDRDALNFVKCLSKLKNTRHLVCRRVELSKLDRDEVTQMRDLAAEIEKTLTDFLTTGSS